MKKSSFLKSSKEMLTRSFNPAKCKTSLKLASSRLKLLRNKKQAQVKQMKRELAQLLESGQDQTARIRVEHVVREEKMMAAYDLIEIYCELIVARLPIIESQKNCPIDLKEAITSVVFASPRCGDIPELVDVRKHLTAKYGKEFISAAVELRPDCGVGRMLVEKLSAKAPDGQTKIKILGAIAEEHGVKWDPKSFGELESVPPNDLLNGPNSIGKANNIREEPTHFEASDVRTPLDHGVSPNARSYYSEENARASLGNQNVISAHGSGRGTAPSSNYHPGGSPSGFRDERSEVEQSFPGDGNFSVGRQSWNMEFKDATSAAQAAAESAERASLAARAAAELAGVTRKYSSEFERSVVHSSGGAGPGTHTSTSIHEHFPNDSATSTVPDRNPQFQNERLDGLGHDNLARAARHNYTRDTSDRPQSQASSRPTGSINNDSFASLQDGDKYRQKSLSKEDSRGKMSMKKPSGKTDVESMSSFEKDSPIENVDYYEEEKPRKEPKINSSGKMSMKKPSGKTEVESMSSFEKDFPTENFNYFGEEKTREEPKINSSDSYSSTSRFGADIPHSSHQSFGYDMTDDPFNGVHQDHVPCETTTTNSHDSSPVAFDDSGSDDDDDIKFDTDPVYEDQQAKLYFPSPERKYKDSWSFDTDKSPEKSPLPSEIFVERHSPPQLSENLAASGNNSQPEIVVPAFDDSDGMNSESDSDMVSPRIGRSKDFQNATHEHGQSHGLPESSFMKKNSGTDRKQWELSSSDKTSFSSAKDKAKHTISQNAKDNIGAPVFNGTQTDDDNLASSVSGFEKEFKFGKITGGLKHKGYIPPPYARSQLNYIPSSVEKAEESPVGASQVASPKSSVGLGMRKKRDDKSSSRVEDTRSASDTDSSEEESLPETSSYGQKTFAQKAGNNRKDAGLRGSTTYFDSDSSDSEVDFSKKESLAGRSQLGGGFSRRTKASSSSLDTSSSSKFKIRSEKPSKFDFGVDRKPIRNSFDAETQEPQKPARNFYVADTQEPQRPTRNFYVADAQEPQRPTRNFYVADAQEPQRPNRNFYVAETQETPTFKKMSPEQTGAEISSSKPVAQPKNTSQESWNSGKVERPSSSAHTEAASSSNDTPKASASSGQGFAREDSMKKASHVHPKLPDYDDIAAKLQSLRMNRK